MNKVDRRKKWPLQIVILASAVSTAQFFGLWFIFLAMTTNSNELQWAPLILQFSLNCCFIFLLVSMSYREFHLSRAVLSVRQTLQEEKQTFKFKEANLRLSKERVEAISKAKSEYLANLCHEFRTPMNAILGFSELLLNDSLTEEQQDYIETVYANSKHLLELIGDVLDLSKIESGQLEIVTEQFPLKKFIEDLEQLICPTIENKSLLFEVFLEENLPQTIIASHMHLRQCLINLISNAVRFTDSGSITLRLSGDSDGIYFDVSDTGIGISDEKFKRIFEPFMQAEKTTSHTFGGTGLGLAITKKLIELMGGGITVQSREGHGTTFTLYLPQDTKNMCDMPSALQAQKTDTDHPHSS